MEQSYQLSSKTLKAIDDSINKIVEEYMSKSLAESPKYIKEQPQHLVSNNVTIKNLKAKVTNKSKAVSKPAAIPQPKKVPVYKAWNPWPAIMKENNVSL